MEVHIDQLPTKSNYVVLEEELNDTLLDMLIQISGTIADASRLSGISKSALGRFFRKENKRIRVDFLLKILDLLNIPSKEVEKNITWVGNNNSKGIDNPKLPFTFSSRASARFLAAICNDGWISDGMYYSNNEQELRESVKRDALSIFGGKEDAVGEWIKEKDQYLAFPSIMRDVLILITGFKGKKSENNPPVPSFILEDKELILGWIEQTIADEGHVKHYPKTYRREIVWRRSFNINLSEYELTKHETKMLDKLGIEYDLKNIGTYKTKGGAEKIRLQIRIAKRKNLVKLRELIIIPSKKKDRAFTEMVEGCKIQGTAKSQKNHQKACYKGTYKICPK